MNSLGLALMIMLETHNEHRDPAARRRAELIAVHRTERPSAGRRLWRRYSR